MRLKAQSVMWIPSHFCCRAHKDFKATLEKPESPDQPYVSKNLPKRPHYWRLQSASRCANATSFSQNHSNWNKPLDLVCRSARCTRLAGHTTKSALNTLQHCSYKCSVFTHISDHSQVPSSIIWSLVFSRQGQMGPRGPPGPSGKPGDDVSTPHDWPAYTVSSSKRSG